MGGLERLRQTYRDLRSLRDRRLRESSLDSSRERGLFAEPRDYGEPIPPVDQVHRPPSSASSAAGQGAPVAPSHPSVSSSDDADVPRSLRLVAAWSWRVLVLVAAIAVLLWLVGRLKTVLIPLSISLLFSALLAPAVRLLRRRARMPRSLATAVVLIGGLVVVVGTLTLVVNEFINGFPSLSDNAADGLRQIQDWLRTGPAHLSSQQLDEALDAFQEWIAENKDTLTSSAVSTAAATLEFFVQGFLVLFATFFFLRDGRKIWGFFVHMLPAGARGPIGGAGDAAWKTLVAYVRATVFVAFIDALGIGLALMGLRVDFALPLAALVFLAAFIPIIGATVSGSVAVLIAMVTRGPWIALAVLAAVIVVQQLEGHVLQPIIMGRAVSIHPLAVIVAIATGSMLAGIIGALVSVPTVAVLNTGIRYLARYRQFDAPAPLAGVPEPEGGESAS